ncbi:MAG: double-strand break repair protein AddB [Pseudolabrys sp.]
MPAAKTNVFDIPASAPFLPVLIRALRDGKLIEGFPDRSDPMSLARATLYLPTRRACRLARDLFLEATGETAAILPRIVPLGDIDEDELIFADMPGPAAADALDLPEALGPLERRLLLARLIAAWAASEGMRGTEGSPLVANTPGAALGLADDLARLMDDMTTRGVGWDKLDGLVPDDLDQYWQQSLKFLRNVLPSWTEHLKTNGLIEPAARRDRLIAAEAARIAKDNAPVIAAGSTGSMPATAALLATIAKLPHGALVLPGLDRHLDEDAWRAIAGDGKARPHDGGTPAAGHAQFAMQALLARIGIARDAVTPLEPAGPREAIVSEALRPAQTTDQWRTRLARDDFPTTADRAFEGIAAIETANMEEEALAIAVVLREAVDTPGKTAALATPDRALARRVIAALERWNVPVYDSGGDRLPDTPAGIFARLVADTAIGRVAPVPLLALLKHPLLRLGRSAGEWSRAIAALERAVLRGPRPRAGTAGLVRALDSFLSDLAAYKTGAHDRFHRSDPRLPIAADDLAAAKEIASRLAAALAPLESATSQSLTLSEFATKHRDVIDALSRDDSGLSVALVGRDGEALASALTEIADNDAAQSLTVDAADYPETFDAVAADRTVRQAEPPDVRVRIFGLLEARLQPTDRLVLGGLNEGVWPPDIRSDPWLSRPMRHQLGLDLPERRIGLAAHDFAQGLGAGEVFLTRAAKVAGAPSVPSRFLQRLAAVVGGKRWAKAAGRGEQYVDWARSLDAPKTPPTPVKAPAPTPPREARPKQLSVTEIEDWLRDPYTIYAKRILGLTPLDAVDTEPGAADRGSVIHAAIGEFTQTYAAALPQDPLQELLAIGRKHFAELADFPEATAFWWPRFERIAQWFVGWERERRAELAAIYGEITGRIPIPLTDGEFTLTARADRIEKRKDDGYTVIDYKTGQHRTEPQVRTGLAPQLTLEAAILQHGGFDGVPKGPAGELLYVLLKGGNPAGDDKPVKFKDGTTESQAEYALKRLTELVRKFDDAREPYRSLVHPMWTTHYGDYDHLARVKEWSASGGASEGGE